MSSPLDDKAMESIYTFVLDYNGGTYISQVKSSSPENAIIKWLQRLDFKELGVQHDNWESVLEDIEFLEDRPVLLEGMKNVWCTSLSFDDTLALIHFVKTDTTCG